MQKRFQIRLLYQARQEKDWHSFNRKTYDCIFQYLASWQALAKKASLESFGLKSLKNFS